MEGENKLKIETDRLVIRSIQYGDEQTFAGMAKDGSLEAIGFDYNCSEWIEDWIKEAVEYDKRNNPKKDYLAYTVCLKEDNKIIGSVGCSWYDDFEKTGVTYFLGNEYRGKGYALESLNAYIEYFFKQYPINKIIATIRENNVNSWKLLDKTDFRLSEKKMWKDYDDPKECMYRFYELEKQ